MPEIKTSVTALKDNKVKLEVEVPPEEVMAQMNHTIKHLAGGVNIPGFRKGKVPRSVLISHIGKETILSQTLNDALPVWYETAILDSGIKPIDKPELDLESLDDDESSFSFKATVEVQPRPQLGKYTGLEVEKDVVEVTDEEVEEPVTRLRRRMARLEPVEGRAAAKGDSVIIDFTGHVDGKSLEGGSGKDYMMELGSGTFIPGFEEQIEGMEPGQSKKLTLTFPDNYQPERLAGREAVFEVTVKEIKERILPEADDKLASDASEFDTIAELRGDIRSKMTKAREEAAERLFRERVLDMVIDGAQVDIPAVMIEKRAAEMKEDFMAAIKESGFTFEGYAEQVGASEAEIEANFKMDAERSIKQELVLDSVTGIEELEVSDEEVENEIRSQAPSLGQDPDNLVKKMKAARREGIIREKLLRQKAMKTLADKAIPVLKKAGPVSEEEKEKQAKIIEP